MSEEQFTLKRGSQYSLAAILYIVTFVAIVLALLAPFVRSTELKNRSGFIVFGVMQILLFVLVVGEAYYLRSGTLRSAGPLLHKVPYFRRSGIGAGLKHIGMLIPFAVFEGLFAFAIYQGGVVATLVVVHPVFWVIQLTVLGLAGRSLLHVVFGIDRGYVAVHQRGYAAGDAAFVPWDTVHAIVPGNQPDKIAVTIDGFGGSRVVTLLRVPAAQRDTACRAMNDAFHSARQIAIG